MTASFPNSFDKRSTWREGGACEGMFGTRVLSGLVDGIDAYRAGLERQPRRSRSLGPAMLGAFKRLDDGELLERIAGFPAACVVVRKLPTEGQAEVNRLKDVVKRGAGFPAGAVPGLPALVLAGRGRAPRVGPTNPMEDLRLPALRTIRAGSGAGAGTGGGGEEGTDEAGSGEEPVPTLHTKMMLLGELWWHDEATLGKAADVAEFTPHRLWLGSANGTERSRRNLEFGLWADDRALLEAAQQFLVRVLAHSQDWPPGTDGAGGPEQGEQTPTGTS